MANRHTSITLPGSSRAGYARHGRATVANMVADIRNYAQRTKALTEEILAAKDEDFRVTTHLGMHIKRRVMVLQEGRKCG